MIEETDIHPTLSDLKYEISSTTDSIGTVKWHKELFRDLTTIGFSLSIIEHAEAIYLLCSNEKYYDAKIILRSSLEHLIELLLIWKGDEAFIERLKLEFNHSQSKMLTAATTGNQYASGLAERIDVKTHLNELEEYKIQIMDRGGKKITVFDRFRFAGHEDMYNTVYATLSKLAHPTFSGIIERHFVIDDDEGSFSVHACRAVEKVTKDLVVDSTIRILQSVRLVLTDNLPAKPS